MKENLKKLEELLAKTEGEEKFDSIVKNIDLANKVFIETKKILNEVKVPKIVVLEKNKDGEIVGQKLFNQADLGQDIP